MPEYLVELFLARADVAELPEAAQRGMRAADELSRQGIAVRYLRSLYVLEDETCFHLFDGPSHDVVAEASRRAAIPCERVAEIVQVAAESLGSDGPSVGDHVQEEER